MFLLLMELIDPDPEGPRPGKDTGKQNGFHRPDWFEELITSGQTGLLFRGYR